METVSQHSEETPRKNLPEFWWNAEPPVLQVHPEESEPGHRIRPSGRTVPGSLVDLEKHPKSFWE